MNKEVKMSERLATKLAREIRGFDVSLKSKDPQVRGFVNRFAPLAKTQTDDDLLEPKR